MLLTHCTQKSHKSKIKLKTHNLPSRLLAICQWPHSNSCTWTHGVRYMYIYIYIYVYIYIYIYVYGIYLYIIYIYIYIYIYISNI